MLYRCINKYIKPLKAGVFLKTFLYPHNCHEEHLQLHRLRRRTSLHVPIWVSRVGAQVVRRFLHVTAWFKWTGALMVSKASTEPLHKCFTSLWSTHARDCISETSALLSPKTAEFLQLEGKILRQHHWWEDTCACGCVHFTSTIQTLRSEAEYSHHLVALRPWILLVLLFVKKL